MKLKFFFLLFLPVSPSQLQLYYLLVQLYSYLRTAVQQLAVQLAAYSKPRTASRVQLAAVQLLVAAYSYSYS